MFSLTQVVHFVRVIWKQCRSDVGTDLHNDMQSLFHSFNNSLEGTVAMFGVQHDVTRALL